MVANGAFGWPNPDPDGKREGPIRLPSSPPPALLSDQSAHSGSAFCITSGGWGLRGEREGGSQLAAR